MKYYRVECCGECGEIVADSAEQARALWNDAVGGECEDPEECGVKVEELPADDEEVCVWMLDADADDIDEAKYSGAELRRHPEYRDVWGEVRTRREWCDRGADALEDLIEMAAATGGGHVTRAYLVWCSVY